jgi:K+-sensing histidine kinase KdpD
MAAVSSFREPQADWGELIEQALWPVRIRWWAVACLVAAIALARGAGVSFPFWTFLAIAAAIIGYNLLLFRLSSGRHSKLTATAAGRRRFTLWQAGLDSAALWALVYLSGGIRSPAVFGFLIPVFCVSVLLPGKTAYRFCAAVLGGVALALAGDLLGFLPHPAIAFRGRELFPAADPATGAASLTCFGAVAFLCSHFSASVVHTFRRQVRELGRLQQAEANFSRKLEALFSIMEAIGSTGQLQQVLDTAVGEVARVMQVRGISVKLLSADGKFLNYAAASGLPESVVREKVVEVAKSPLNRRIIDGESYVAGQVTAKDMFQFGEALIEARIQSVLFLPLKCNSRVIGILGAYCEKPERFSEKDVDFFRLTAQLVAVAIENARAYEAVEKMSKDRGWFMMKVTHNLRAPLVGMLSILEVVRDGYLGPINDEQNEYLRRLDRRARTMLTMINDLMMLARNRERREPVSHGATDADTLAGRIRRTFQDRAAGKRIAFQVHVAAGVPPIGAPLETVEQVMENLVSNAITYTPPEGRVAVSFSKADGTVRIEVSDNGIGIPRTDRPRLFTEFFRAENAKAVEETGTGLGLSIVKEIVDQQGGRILVESEEGVGTIFVVHLPVAPATREEDA